jgi:hypothetical protein
MRSFSLCVYRLIWNQMDLVDGMCLCVYESSIIPSVKGGGGEECTLCVAWIHSFISLRLMLCIQKLMSSDVKYLFGLSESYPLFVMLSCFQHSTPFTTSFQLPRPLHQEIRGRSIRFVAFSKQGEISTSSRDDIPETFDKIQCEETNIKKLLACNRQQLPLILE